MITNEERALQTGMLSLLNIELLFVVYRAQCRVFDNFVNDPIVNKTPEIPC